MFYPDSGMKRVDYVVAMGKMQGINYSNFNTNPFTDLSGLTVIQRGYISWAYTIGMINGTTPTTFSPNNTLNRAEFAKVLDYFSSYYSKALPQNKPKTTYADDSSIPSWAKDGVYRLQRAGILTGQLNNYYNPNATLTRAETATALYRFYCVTTLFRSGTIEPPCRHIRRRQLTPATLSMAQCRKLIIIIIFIVSLQINLQQNRALMLFPLQ